MLKFPRKQHFQPTAYNLLLASHRDTQFSCLSHWFSPGLYLATPSLLWLVLSNETSEHRLWLLLVIKSVFFPQLYQNKTSKIIKIIEAIESEQLSLFCNCRKQNVVGCCSIFHLRKSSFEITLYMLDPESDPQAKSWQSKEPQGILNWKYFVCHWPSKLNNVRFLPFLSCH